MQAILEIFSQGEEVVTGQIVDSNAAWLSQQTVQLGFKVSRHTAVGDKLTDLAALLTEIAGRADCCLCTGGLGPTSDDLTAEAVAQAFGSVLEFDPVAYAQIEQFYKNRSKAMPASNRKQALLPQGSLRLDNQCGTAPGFAIRHQRCWFAFMPGVPSEMRSMYLEKILPILQQNFKLHPKTLVTLKTVGIGESELQQRLNPITIPPEVELGFRAAEGEVQVKLLFPHAYPEPAMRQLSDTISAQIGSSVFAIDGLDEPSGDLLATINRLMLAKQHKLSLIETATQGWISGLCIGASWLLESHYQNQLEKLAAELAIHIHPQDHFATAHAIAKAKLKNSAADIILVQLYTGDQHQFLEPSQAIVIYNVLLTAGGEFQAMHTVAGSCKRKQNQSALLALDLLRRYLQNKL